MIVSEDEQEDEDEQQDSDDEEHDHDQPEADDYIQGDVVGVFETRFYHLNLESMQPILLILVVEH